MEIPSLFLGTFEYKNVSELSSIVDLALSCGLRGFDTSPSYKTEQMLGDVLTVLTPKHQLSRDQIFIQDKIDGWQMQKSKGDVTHFINESLNLLNVDYLDGVFIHWPFPEYLNQTWKTLISLKNSGLIKYIGLSNVHVRHLEKITNETGVKPDMIQIERHPLRTCYPEIEYCNKECIYIESYSPICRMDKRLQESNILKDIAKKYGKTLGQIILRWQLDTGAIPVFMSKNPFRIVENMSLFDFVLSKDEIYQIDSLNQNYKIFVESVCCPGI